MKKQSNTLFNQISTQELKNITNIVKETLHVGLKEPVKKIFTAADLWNIQRQKKALSSRRFSI